MTGWILQTAAEANHTAEGVSFRRESAIEILKQNEMKRPNWVRQNISCHDRSGTRSYRCENGLLGKKVSYFRRSCKKFGWGAPCTSTRATG
jgi:hypothetical protein